MKIIYGKEITEYGPGVDINLTGDEVALAIDTWLTAHQVYISGPRTITVNGKLIKDGKVHIDPSGFVVSKGEKFIGKIRTVKYDSTGEYDLSKVTIKIVKDGERDDKIL